MYWPGLGLSRSLCLGSLCLKSMNGPRRKQIHYNPKGGGSNLLFWQVFLQNFNRGRGGGQASEASPLDSPTVISHKKVILNNFFFHLFVALSPL